MYNFEMNIIYFDKIDSTNTYAKTNIDALADKTVISTNMQTQGRGRFTRTWVNVGSDNIYMTIVLKPSENFSEVYSNLTQYLSVVLCRVLEGLADPYTLEPKIKWPNDVLLNGKKVSGILAETVIRGGKLKGIVLGIGVNLNAPQEILSQIDRPATAINIELGKDICKQEFLEKLLVEFFKGYDSFLKNGFQSIKAEYVKRASFLNQELDISIFNKIQSGFSKDVDNNGALVLVDKDGVEHFINMGEIV